MTKGSIVTLSVIGAIVLVILICVGSIVGVNNNCVSMENGIFASFEQMQNVNGALVNKVKSSGFTVQNYSKTFIKGIEANIKRYANDKNLLMKWVQESQAQSPNPEIWTKLQDTIEAGYTEFEASQRDKIDRVRIYRTYTKVFPNVIFANMFGFPTKKATDIMDKIISTKDTKKTFTTGEMDSVNPF